MSNDARYAFLFENANVGGDTMAESVSQLFRLPADGKPMTIMQLAGFPAEVVDPVEPLIYEEMRTIFDVRERDRSRSVSCSRTRPSTSASTSMRC